MSATALLNISKAGFTDAQVTALAEYFDSQVATKADIAELRTEIVESKAELKLDIERVRSDTIKWVTGLLIAQGAAIVALVRFPGVHS